VITKEHMHCSEGVSGTLGSRLAWARLTQPRLLKSPNRSYPSANPGNDASTSSSWKSSLESIRLVSAFLN